MWERPELPHFTVEETETLRILSSTTSLLYLEVVVLTEPLPPATTFQLRSLRVAV